MNITINVLNIFFTKSIKEFIHDKNKNLETSKLSLNRESTASLLTMLPQVVGPNVFLETSIEHAFFPTYSYIFKSLATSYIYIYIYIYAN